MCEALEVSASGYYAWAARPDSPTDQWRQELVGAIEEIHAEVKHRYGSPRMTAELNARGHDCTENTVAKLMRTHGIKAKTVRRFVRTTDSRHGLPVADNLLGRDFAPAGPNRAWSADITYIPTAEGWLYLAVVLDLFSRRVVGWATAETLHADLPCAALRMALGHRRPFGELLHHSDRGSQYASSSYRQILAGSAIEPSMSRAGNCWDNAVTESFFGTLKRELTHHESYATREEARASLFEYIEVFYNRRRLHSTLGYRSPVEFEIRFAS